MKNGKIGIGIIGAGNIAQNAHLPSYAKHKDCEIVSIFDHKPGRAAQCAAKFAPGDAPRVADSLDDLLNNKDVDAVSVCTWNNDHAASCIAALKAGKHVLCEKPMAMTVAEAEAMKAAADASGKVFLTGFVSRFRSDVQIIREMAEEGKFGTFYYARASSLRRRGTPLGWFTDPKKAGGGPVIDIGVHVLDMTWYLLGKPEPTAVSATVHTRIGDYKTKGVSRWEAFDTDNLVFGVEDSAAGMIRFANGCSLNFDVSWALNGEPSEAHSAWLYGDKAGCSLLPFKVFGEDAGYLTDNVPVLDKGGRDFDNVFVRETRHFLDCILGKCQPISPASDGLAVQKILNGIYDSAAAGKEIAL
jgi:predicted dehydrogenase